MCGIVGVYEYGRRSVQVPEALIDRMCRIIAHRGPDDQGIHLSGNFGMGMRRLSIIDLSGGHQPMHNEDGSVQIVFNGEIWNYKALRAQLEDRGHSFYSNSDTEAIVHSYEEWGEDCTKHLRGMFGFAIWDENKRRVFIARDRLGKKPLYYYHENGVLVFGSEIKSLLMHPEVPREPDLEGISQYLTFRYVIAPLTTFRGIKKLSPGHSLTCDENGVRTQEYWDLHVGETCTRSLPECEEELRELLTDCVRMRLMSDVPLGAMLSGGIDSSIIVGLMSGMIDQPVKTFSVGFGEREFSELDYAGIASKKFGTDHHELIVSYQDMVDNIETVTWHRDEPVTEPAEIPTYLVSKLARTLVKVVLTGEGGDECFAGYPKYYYDRYARYYQVIPKPLRDCLCSPLVQHLPYKFRKIKIAERAMTLPQLQRWTSWFCAFEGESKNNLISPEFAARVDADSSRYLEPFVGKTNSADNLQKMLYVDIKTWLPDDLLMKGDKMSMAASIEARVPFLDHELMEFAARVPSQFKIRNKITKFILKDTFKDLIPREIIERPKAGFPVPIGPWFRKGLGEMAREMLLSEESRRRGYYNMASLQRVLDDHIAGKFDYQRQLWTLLSLEVWHRVFIDPTSVREEPVVL